MHLPHSGSSPAHLSLIAFWSAAVLIFYTYLGYPVLLQIMALFSRREPAQPCEDPKLTLLICAHNEASSIAEKLNNTLSLNYDKRKLQILVVSDGSTDKTESIVQTFSDRGVQLLRIDPQGGKTNAQNEALEYATGEIVVFSDATTFYSPDALRYLAGNFSNPNVGAVSGCYVYHDPTNLSPNAAGAVAYAGYDNRIRRLQSTSGSITGCCGCIYAVRRSLYTKLDAAIISDLVQPLHVLQRGFQVTYEPRAMAWEKATSSSAREFSMRVRVVCRAFAGLLSVPSLLLPWRHPWTALQLWSHKLLRWCLPVLLLVLFLSSVALASSPFYAFLLAMQAIVYLTALLSLIFPLHRISGLLGLPLYFCTVNLAAIGGLIQFARNERYAVWQPVREEMNDLR